ncbi:MAG: low molecular weight phosphatase family protein [Thermoplasmatota archaeon]
MQNSKRLGAVAVSAALIAAALATPALADRAEKVGDESGERGPIRVIFVCTGNSARSQMAEAFARQHGLEAESAGTMPAAEVSKGAILAMREKGLDISSHKPKRVDFNRLADFEQIVCMGPGVAATSPDLHFHEDWGIDDPVNMDFAIYRRVRDEIEAKVRALAIEIREWSSAHSDYEEAFVAT